MKLNKLTQLIKLLLLKDINFVSICKKLNNQEKKIVINYVVDSKIEDQVLNFPSDKLKNIFSDKQLDALNYYQKKRQLKTIENLRFANLIAKDLEEKNIRYVFLKGISQYGNGKIKNYERNIFDIDLLVDKDKLTDVLQVCKKNGFQIEDWNNNDLSDAVIFTNPTIKHSDGFSMIDIHLDISFKNSCSNSNQIFNKAFKTKTKQIEGTFCSLEDLFIHTLYHGACKGVFNVGPIFLLDMVRFIENKKVNWHKVKQDLKAFDLEQYLIDVLQVAKHFVDLPNEIQDLYKGRPTLQSDDMLMIMLGQPNNINLFSKDNERISQKIFNKFFSKKTFLFHSKDNFKIIKYLKSLMRSFRLFFIKIFRNKRSHELMHLRKNYSDLVKGLISKPKS